MSLNSIYSAGILRVAHKASALGILLPADSWQPESKESNNKSIYCTRLGSVLMNHIEDPNIRYVYRLVHSIHTPPDWYSIKYSDTCPLSRYEDFECAHNKGFAIRHVRELAEQEGVTLTEDYCEDGSIRFFLGATVVVTLVPMVFSSVDELLVRKAKSILKQITSIHSGHCLTKILSPLLDNNSLDSECVEQHDDLSQYAIHSTLGNLASSMLRAMERLDVIVSRGHAQELLAAFFDFQSWNHMRAIERAVEGIAINPVVVVDHRHDVPITRFFQDANSALAFFSTAMNKKSAYMAETNSTYGTLYIRQPPHGEHTFDSWPPTDREDKALVMYTLTQVDRYELDPLIPLNQPDNAAIFWRQ